MTSARSTAIADPAVFPRPPKSSASAAQPFGVFVINLDRSPDRLAFMTEALGRAGLSFERVPGVLGTDLPPDLRPFFVDADGSLPASLKAGEVGCHAAHLAACRRLRESGAAAGLVLEDDAALDDDLGSLIEKLLATLPEGWDVVRLSNPPKRAYVPVGDLGEGRRLVRYSKVPNCAIAYLLSASGARKMFQPGLRTLELDEFMRRPWLSGLDTYGVLPPPAGIASLGSMIDAIEDRRGRVKPNLIANNLAKSDLANLGRRLRFELDALGASRWLACFLLNAVDHFPRWFWHGTFIHRAAGWLALRGGVPDRSGARR